MLDKKIKKQIQKIVQEFIECKEFNSNEDHVQAHYTIRILEALGWGRCQIKIKSASKAGKFPDIILLDRDGFPMYVIESKKPNVDLGHFEQKENKARKYFYDKLGDYCLEQGVYWGSLTNFREWRIYSAHKKEQFNKKKIELYDEKKKRPIFNKDTEEFFEKLTYDYLYENNGEISDADKWYPEEEEIKNDFFEKLSKWRKLIRTHIKRYPKIKNLEQANFETQLILDRLIFMKVCLDKKIEIENRLSYILHSSKHKYTDLKKEFKELDKKFDSSLFFHDLADDIHIENKIIKKVIKELYRINFSKLGVHIIGEVYENYLGEILTEESSLSENEKKKKNQGIYYTPKKVVQYMVNNSLGKKISNFKTMAELESIKVVDPACGSGSMLIESFECLYLKYKELCKDKKTSFEIARKILTKNLYGVDLDERAVQIAQLNLLLKALEKTDRKEIKGKDNLFPDLSFNIRCGNSLIFADDKPLSSVNSSKLEKIKKLKKKFRINDDKEVKKKILEYENDINSSLNEELKNSFIDSNKERPFNYKIYFCEVFDNGGFDIAIGNPPYVDSENMVKYQPQLRSFITNNYTCASGNWDLYIPFWELSSNLINQEGVATLITPNKWLSIAYGEALRNYFQKCVYKIADYSKISGVFKNVGVFPIVTFISGKTKSSVNIELYENDYVLVHKNTVKRKILKEFKNWGVLLSKHLPFIIKLLDKHKKIESINDIFLEEAFTVSEAYQLQQYLQERRKTRCKKAFKFINTGTIDKFTSLWGAKNATYLKKKYLEPIVNEKILKSNFPTRYEQAKAKKIIIAGIRHFESILDKKGEYLAGKSTIILKSNNNDYDLDFILAILNSNLVSFYLKESYGALAMDGGINFTSTNISQIPFPKISFRIIDKIKKIIKKILRITKEPFDESKLKKIKKHENKLNGLIYKLYKLTSKEIAVVELPIFIKELRNLDSDKDKLALIASKTEEELDLIGEELDKCRGGKSHVFSPEEASDLNALMTSARQ